jgi:hypothetical protein
MYSRLGQSTWDSWWTKWLWDRFFSEFFSYPHQYHSTMALHSHISIGGWTTGLLVAAVQRQSHPADMNINMDVDVQEIFLVLMVRVVCRLHLTLAFHLMNLFTRSLPLIRCALKVRTNLYPSTFLFLVRFLRTTLAYIVLILHYVVKINSSLFKFKWFV